MTYYSTKYTIALGTVATLSDFTGQKEENLSASSATNLGMNWASAGTVGILIAAALAGYFVGTERGDNRVTTTTTTTQTVSASLSIQWGSATLILGMNCSRCQTNIPLGVLTIDGVPANSTMGTRGVVLTSGTAHTITAASNYTGACVVVEPPCSSSGRSVTVYFVKWASCEWYQVPGNWSVTCNVVPEIESPYMTSQIITVPEPAPGGSITIMYGAIYSPYKT